MSKGMCKWDMARLGDVASLITKGTTPTTIGFQFENSGINFVKIESITGAGKFLDDKFEHISDECNEKLKRSMLCENDILFSIAGALGRTAIVCEDILPANINQALAIIRIPKGKVDYRFIQLTLKSPLVYKQFQKQKQGVAQLNLSLKNISDLEIPLPPLDVQKNVANTLDKAQEIIDGHKKQLEELDNLIKAVFYEMFGDFSDFQRVKLIELIVAGAGLSYGIVQPGDDMGEGVGILRPVDIKDGKLVLEEVKRIAEVVEEPYKKTRLNGNEILITVRGTTGETAITNIKCLGMNVTRGIAVIRHNDKMINKVYLNEYLKSSESQQYIQENTKGATLKQINLSDLKELKIPLPYMNLQNKFAEIVTNIEAQKTLVKQSITESQNLLDSLMSEYFD